jgi:hypothetical protein
MAEDDPVGGPQAESLRQASRAGVQRGRDAAAAGAESIAGTAGELAGRLAPQSDSLAQCAQRFSEGASRLATRLRTHSLDELMGEAQTAARSSPALFLAGSLLAGVALSRFMKASARRHGPKDADGWSTPRGPERREVQRPDQPEEL